MDLDSTKPVFTTYDNSLALGIYADFSEKSFADVYALGFYYAQPNTFFRINGRISLELEAFLPIKPPLKRQIIFGAAQDIILPIYKSLYECIIKHYSNGNLERPNIGYNYLGLNAGVAF